MSDEFAVLREEVATLRATVARLEAKEEVVALFNCYLHGLDLDRADDVVACFASDAILHVINFPPGSGTDLHLRGPDEIRPLYARHAGALEPSIKGGHHAANRGVEVSADAKSAQLSAYFLTAAGTGGWIQGGMYQMRAERRPQGWRVAEMNIISGWGWRVGDPQPITDSVPAAKAWRDGRPATWSAC